MTTVLVFGATGDQGLPLMRALTAQGFRVRAATRQPDAFPRDPFPHVEIVGAAFEDVASLTKACAGADAIAMNLPFSFDRAYARMMGENICAAARAAGSVRKIVFNTSCVIAPTDIGLAAHDGRRDIEAAMAASGLAWASIRSVVFMDNILRPWVKPAILSHGVFAYPARDDLKINFVCLDDVAAYMAAAVAEPRVTAHAFAIGGPEALTGHDAAARLSVALNRPIRFQSLKPAEFARGMAKLITGSDHVEPNSMWSRVAQFYAWYNDQPQSPLEVDLRPALALLPVQPTPMLVWAKRQDWSA
ncbi:MAG: NmrA family NAD(P)-binding protein [Hyphomonadaceae bacterium]|nr:NmrA family NAD(P)-binding protein [Hyphomonadaceae bacterium]